MPWHRVISGLWLSRVTGPGGPGHALALTPSTGVTKVGALRYRTVVLSAGHRYYGPLGLPLGSARFHHRLIRPVFADEAAETDLFCSAANRKERATSRTPGRPSAPVPKVRAPDVAFAVT